MTWVHRHTRSWAPLGPLLLQAPQLRLHLEVRQRQKGHLAACCGLGMLTLLLLWVEAGMGCSACSFSRSTPWTWPHELCIADKSHEKSLT